MKSILLVGKKKKKKYEVLAIFMEFYGGKIEII